PGAGPGPHRPGTPRRGPLPRLAAACRPVAGAPLRRERRPARRTRAPCQPGPDRPDARPARAWRRPATTARPASRPRRRMKLYRNLLLWLAPALLGALA